MIDAHAHLSDVRLVPILDDLVVALRDKGLQHVVLGGIDPDDWTRQKAILKRYPNFVTTAFGIHPWTVRDRSDAQLELMFDRLRREISHAGFLGEIGLDFYSCKNSHDRVRQERWCQRQIDLAMAERKPVVLHVVRGHDRMISILRRVGGAKGLVHGFTGSKEIAREYLRLGLTLSMGLRSFRGQSAGQWSWLKGVDVVVESDEPLCQAEFSDAASLAERWVSSLDGAERFLAAAGVPVKSPLSL
jgi:TatD DNase family protein